MSMKQSCDVMSQLLSEENKKQQSQMTMSHTHLKLQIVCPLWFVVLLEVAKELLYLALKDETSNVTVVYPPIWQKHRCWY